MPARFEGTVALVTGGAGAGIGGAVVRRLATEGAAVAVADIHPKRTEELVRGLRDEGYEAGGYVVDIADRAAVNHAVELVEKELGAVDLLVNNAAVNHLGAVAEVDGEDWDRSLAVDLTGAFNCIRAVLPGMLERRRGSIVNISSIAAWMAVNENEGAGYTAAKAGLQALTRAVAKQAGPAGVRANAIAPGIIWSKFVERHSARFEAHLADIPLRRFGRAEEVAGLVAFLASDDAAYITGETVVIAGGSLMRA